MSCSCERLDERLTRPVQLPLAHERGTGFVVAVGAALVVEAGATALGVAGDGGGEVDPGDALHAPTSPR